MKDYYLFAAITAFFSTILGVFAKYHFVPKKHLYTNTGQPIYMNKENCHEIHAEIKQDIRSLHQDVKKLDRCIIRIEALLNGKTNRRD